MLETHPYYAPSGILRLWELHEGECGCIQVPIVGLCVSTDRSPPVTKEDRIQDAAALTEHRAERKAKGYGFFKGALRELLEERRIKAESAATATKPAVSSPVAKPPEAKAKPPIPFDLQDIPAAMRKMGWVKSADLMDQWFKGRLNYSRNKSDESKGIDQNGHPYAAEFIETKRFTWEWLRKYGAVDNGFKAMSSTAYLTSVKANAKGQSAYSTIRSNVLAAVAAKVDWYSGSIDSKYECNDNLMELHRRFQFQHYDLNILSYPNTDLGGSLGDFSIYAAIAYIEVERHDFRPHTATVTHAYLYVKDNYSYTDDGSGSSQYLGHWNRNGVVYAPMATVAELAKKIPLFGHYIGEIPSGPWDLNPQPGVDFPIYIDPNPDLVFYPVHNRDFWKWQMKHQRGGNIISFSDLKLVRLDPPIQFQI